MKIAIVQLFLTLVTYVAPALILNDLPEDARLNFTGLVEKYGHNHKCEEFDVITKDKYILKLFHIKGDPKRPILLGHGNNADADSWFLRGFNSIGSILAKEGYDLWFLNMRGNTYSRRHLTLNPDTDSKYWDWSFNEIGFYDLPANIDKVLKTINQTQLTYLGYSQGNEISFVLTSLKPEYNSKIKVNIAVAPYAFVHNINSPLILLGLIWPNIPLIGDIADPYEIFGGDRTAYETTCSVKVIGYETCFKPLLAVSGTKPSEIPPDFFNVILGHFPSSSSVKNLHHNAQLMNSKRFAQFDYGKKKNWELYGTPYPTDYPLEKCNSSVVLFAGLDDKLGDIVDVKILQSRLPNVRLHEFPGKGHLDFIWGKDVKNFTSLLLETIKEYN